MRYTEINARRDMAKRLFEAQYHLRLSWVDAAPEIKRSYEADIEKLLDPRNEEVRTALRALGFDHAGP